MPDDALELAVLPLQATQRRSFGALSLADLPKGARAIVRGVSTPAIAEGAQLALRLQEIGFVQGAPLRVIARGFPAGEPIAVRVGGTTFALRGFEAQCVLVAVS